MALNIGPSDSLYCFDKQLNLTYTHLCGKEYHNNIWFCTHWTCLLRREYKISESPANLGIFKSTGNKTLEIVPKPGNVFFFSEQ